MSDRLAVLRKLNAQPYSPRRNCLWLAREVQRRLFGRDLPLGDLRLLGDILARSAAVQAHPFRAAWREVAEPSDGSFVLMGHAGLPDVHCGVYLADLGAVLHTDDPHGVTYDPLPALRVRWTRLLILDPLIAP